MDTKKIPYFTVTLDSTRTQVIKVNYNNPPINTNKQLTKLNIMINNYKNDLVQHNFIIAKINIKEFKSLITKFLSKLNKYSDISSLANNVNLFDIKNYMDNIKFGTNYAMYALVENDEYDNDDSISIVISNSLFTSNYNNFINLYFNADHIPVTTPELTKVLSHAKKIIQSFFKGLNSANNNFENNKIKFINITYLLLNIGIIGTILSNFYKNFIYNNDLNIFYLISEMLGEFVSYFPDNDCYFNHHELITFDPNICKNKNNKMIEPFDNIKVCPYSKIINIFGIVVICYLLNKTLHFP